MRGAFPSAIAAPRFTAERSPINSMDPSVATRLTRMLSDAPDLRATVDRLRRSNERPAASSWHGFCAVPPPLRQQQHEGSSATENSLAPQSIILGEIERVQANHGASVRILAVWPPGTTAPLKEPPVESRGVGVRAFLHGSRSHPPHASILSAEGDSSNSVLLPSWLVEDTLLFGLVVSAEEQGGGGGGGPSPGGPGRVALSLCASDLLCDGATAATISPLLGECHVRENKLPEALRASIERARNSRRGSSSSGSSVNSSLTLAEHLASQPAYHHPRASDRMRKSLHLPNLLSCLPPASDAVIKHSGKYIELRTSQNKLWASESVARGVSHAKSNRMSEALSSYAHALELDPSNADAYVARGAAYANTEKYDEALLDFERALKHEPGHLNARSYLEATRAKLKQREPPKSPRRVPPQAASSVSSAALVPVPPPAQQAVATAEAAGAASSAAAADGSGTTTQAAVLERVVEVLAEQQRGSASEKKRKHHREAEEEDGSTSKREKHSSSHKHKSSKHHGKSSGSKHHHRKHHHRSKEEKKHKKRRRRSSDSSSSEEEEVEKEEKAE